LKPCAFLACSAGALPDYDARVFRFDEPLFRGVQHRARVPYDVSNAVRNPRKTSLLEMKQESPHFWHVRSQNNQLLIETYCLLCFKFLGASELAFNLALVSWRIALSAIRRAVPIELGRRLPRS